MEKDFRRSMESLKENPNREEIVRSRRIAVNMFKDRYKHFQVHNKQQLDLYAGDFRPLQEKSLTSQRPLQIMLPVNDFMPIEYEDLYTRFIKTFSRDLDNYDINTGVGKGVPEANTKATRQFLKQWPGEELPYSYMYYLLKSDIYTEKRIEVIRYYLDIKSARPLAEVWRAATYPRF